MATECCWIELDDAVYQSECGRVVEFGAAGPVEADWSYCPHCGRSLFLMPIDPNRPLE
jgi:hypothetical protein